MLTLQEQGLVNAFCDKTLLDFKSLWEDNRQLECREIYEKWKPAIQESKCDYFTFISRLRITVEDKKERMKRLYKIEKSNEDTFENNVYDTLEALEAVFSIN